MKKLSIILLLILPSIFFSQQSISFGVKIDAFALNTEKFTTVTNSQKGFNYFPPSAVYLFLKGNLSNESKSFYVLRIGALDAKDFNGFEFGALFEKYFMENTYLLLGLNMHFNKEKIIRTDMIDKSHSKTINLLTAGLGYDLTNSLFAEMSFDYSLNREYGITTPLDQNIPAKPKSIYNVIRFGIGYKF